MTNIIDEAKEAYEQFESNKERFKHEIRVHHNQRTDLYQFVDALFLDGKLVGSMPISEKFECKDCAMKYAKNIYHALRRNILVTVAEPVENQIETSLTQ